MSVGLARDIEATRDLVKAVQDEAKSRGWEDDPDLLIAIARALAELGELNEAAATYDRAIRDAQTTAPIKAIEQHASLRARAAVVAFKSSPRSEDARKAAVDEIDRAIAQIENLARLAGDTPERWSLRGSCWKRKAQITQGDERSKALVEMAECHKNGMMPGDRGRLYRQLRFATGRIALALSTGSEIDAETKQAVNEVLARLGDTFDSWRLISSADAKLLGAIVEGKIDREKETKLLDAYRDAWRFGGSPLNLMSVLEQFTFFQDVLTDGMAQALAEKLGRMRGLLETHLRSSAAPRCEGTRCMETTDRVGEVAEAEPASPMRADHRAGEVGQ